jgi:hypothetical protein
MKNPNPNAPSLSVELKTPASRTCGRSPMSLIIVFACEKNVLNTILKGPDTKKTRSLSGKNTIFARKSRETRKKHENIFFSWEKHETTSSRRLSLIFLPPCFCHNPPISAPQEMNMLALPFTFYQIPFPL